MYSQAFQNCCGINIITGWPFDSDAGDWAVSQLEDLEEKLASLEGNYCHCHLIALNSRQTIAGKEVLAAGYKLIGTFASAHNNGTRVCLYAKGLTLGKPKKRKRK